MKFKFTAIQKQWVLYVSKEFKLLNQNSTAEKKYRIENVAGVFHFTLL